MLTRKALNTLLTEVYKELSANDLKPDRMILFGSYAKENIHEYSDVDIALWNNKFCGEGMIDFELIRTILRKFRGVHCLDFKMYPTGARADNFDPFIEEIEKTGLEWNADLLQLSNVKNIEVKI